MKSGKNKYEKRNQRPKNLSILVLWKKIFSIFLIFSIIVLELMMKYVKTNLQKWNQRPKKLLCHSFQTILWFFFVECFLELFWKYLKMMKYDKINIKNEISAPKNLYILVFKRFYEKKINNFWNCSRKWNQCPETVLNHSC